MKIMTVEEASQLERELQLGDPAKVRLPDGRLLSELHADRVDAPTTGPSSDKGAAPTHVRMQSVDGYLVSAPVEAPTEAPSAPPPEPENILVRENTRRARPE